MRKHSFNVAAYRRKWGLPDWRDADEYPITLSDDLWRWEFLRRREDYRNDWERSYPATAEWYRSHTPEDAFRGINYLGHVLHDNFFNGPESPNFCAQMEGSLPKYGLIGMPNPTIPTPKNLRFNTSHQVSIEFDLSLSIDDLMKCAETAFKALKSRYGKSDHRKRRNKWATYLRVLDARAEHASYVKIGEVLKPDLIYSEASSRVYAMWEAAIALQQTICHSK